MTKPPLVLEVGKSMSPEHDLERRGSIIKLRDGILDPLIACPRVYDESHPLDIAVVHAP